FLPTITRMVTDIAMPDADRQAAPNPGLAVLINALSGGGRLDPIALLRSMQTQAEDPQMAVLLSLLEQRQSVEASPPADVEAADEAASEDESEKLLAMKNLEEKVQRMYAELEVLRGRNDSLAIALGACYLCFGDDSLCQECQGRGVPGSRRPDPAAFRQYV